ncbi:MAG: 5-carboxymethyl-2-hydroxymuconate Delta-isomerase [Betaproteobacteria bacterium]|nr:5-carboxymethyl-2-hydroxymuconate Delta-isomerase [Betaproteobacteria bacterium]
MPHLVILYTGNLDAPVAQGGSDIDALCRNLADAMLGVKDETGKQVFPTGGVRVLAYPAPHFAVADGGAAGRAAGQAADYGFVYLNLRMGRGRSAALQQLAGQRLEAVAKAHFAPQLAHRPIGVTLQIDEGPEVFDAKSSSLHPLFQPKP